MFTPNRGGMLLKVAAFGCQKLKSIAVTLDKMAKWSEHMIEAKRVNCADVVVAIIAWLNM